MEVGAGGGSAVLVVVVGSRFKAKVRFMGRSKSCCGSSTQLMSVNQEPEAEVRGRLAEQEGGCRGEGNGFHYGARSEGREAVIRARAPRQQMAL